MTVGDLTTLANAKQWYFQNNPATQTVDDALLQRLVSAASRFIMSWLSRPSMVLNSYTATISGVGQSYILLPNWPVISVSSVTLNTTSIAAASTPLTAGYLLEPWDGLPPGSEQKLMFNGYRVSKGFNNLVVAYAAGYVVSAESQTAATSVAVDGPYGNWAQDEGVAYATDGTALTKVTGVPAQGQYALSGTIPGTYIFNAADVGEELLITYSYIPSDIEQACCEMVGERYAYRTHIGQTSKNIGVGGETVSYNVKDMPDFVKTLLQQYKRVQVFY